MVTNKQQHDYFTVEILFRHEPLHVCKNKEANQLQLICAFIFATKLVYFVQLLFFLNPKFQASSHLLWQHRLVCV